VVKLLNIQPDTAVLIYQFVVQMIRFEVLVKHFTGMLSHLPVLIKKSSSNIALKTQTKVKRSLQTSARKQMFVRTQAQE
jgi:hypothetical protein